MLKQPLLVYVGSADHDKSHGETGRSTGGGERTR